MKHINVTLRMGRMEEDVRLPEKMEIRRLIKELDHIFGLTIQRKKYQIRVVNKGLLLEEGDTFVARQVTNGDVLEVEEMV